MRYYGGGEMAASLPGVRDNTIQVECVTMPPGAQPDPTRRSETRLSPNEHEMHHPGRLTTIQRMIGMKPHLTRQLEARFAQPALDAPQPAQAAR